MQRSRWTIRRRKMGLAEEVIQANAQEFIEKEKGDKAPNGYYTDDLGYWVEQDIRQHKMRFAEYVYFRCRKLNPDLHVRDGRRLFNGPTMVKRDQLSIASLARLPEQLSKPNANWVYDKIFEEVPRLDRSKIEIVPGWLWDVEKSKIIKEVI